MLIKRRSRLEDDLETNKLNLLCVLLPKVLKNTVRITNQL